jgi:hypothetical protein
MSGKAKGLVKGDSKITNCAQKGDMRKGDSQQRPINPSQALTASNPNKLGFRWIQEEAIGGQPCREGIHHPTH